MKLKSIALYMIRAGLVQGAIALEVDDVATLPEFQRSWYDQDATTKKFKLNPAKVEVEDVSGLKRTVEATRTEAREAKRLSDQRVADALKPFEGIDPVKTRALLDKFNGEDEAALIAAGKIDEVINRRMEKHTKAQQKLIDDAAAREGGAMELAQSLMEDAVDNKVRAACAKAGLHASAVEDALLRARAIFTLDDDKNVIQLDENDEVVLGKDGKTPFSPGEWLEGMKESAPHWFPAGGTGGGAGGSRLKSGGQDLSGLSPVARLTAARAAQAGQK